jgi:putative ABC transport system substrate-binding protein
VIGFLNGGREPANRRRVAAFRQGLLEAGFVEGPNVAIEFRWANLQFRQLPSLVSDLINRQAAVIFAGDSRGPIRAAQAATATIPIVFSYGGDPVKDGFVASLSRPGRNLTGLTAMTSELGPKRLSLLHEMVPQADTIGFLTERGGDDTAVLEHQNDIRGAARSLGLELVEAVGPSGVQLGLLDQILERAFVTFAERQVGAVLVDNVATLLVATPAIVRLEQQYKIPTMYPAAGAVRGGGLMSYGGTDVFGRVYHQAASAEPLIAVDREINLIAVRRERLYKLLACFRIVFNDKNVALISHHDVVFLTGLNRIESTIKCPPVDSLGMALAVGVLLSANDKQWPAPDWFAASK